MGVAYSHGLFVQPVTWRPTAAHADALVAVLTTWGFTEPVFVVDGEEVDAAAARNADNVIVVLTGPEGAAAAKIMGPSIYKELADEDRYIVQAEIHLASDLKVITSIEGDEVDITKPPMEDGELLDAEDDAEPHAPVMTLYRASWDATPPKTSAKGFDRVWRCAVILDCDKDVPAIAEPMAPLPASGFVRDLAAAFGTKLVELGWYH